MKFFKEKIVWIAAFGYFVDLFDLVLYGVVRVESLKSLGYSGHDIFIVGARLLNIQMLGMLVGGFFWGILGDRRGRKEALFGSIFIYSLATFLNAYVHTFEGYAALRFLAGLGLAGELGAAITLVSEALPQKIRGLGSAWVTAVGFAGAVCSSYFCQRLPWQQAYQLGGALGGVLLLARMTIKNPALYVDSKKNADALTTWGSISLLVSSRPRLKIFTLALLAGFPIWYVGGILSYFAPELARDLEIQGEISAGTTIMWGYLGAIVGDILCGLTSQLLQSRKKAIFGFMIFGAAIAIFHPYFIRGSSPETFYYVRGLIGLSNGFFAILIAWVAELFGTNLRATTTTVLSNLVRAALIPLTLSFEALRPLFGITNSAMILGMVCFGMALISVLKLPETFHRDLNFVEK